MNWIDKLLPVITLVLGWGLAQFGKFWTDKKNDQKKLKKLLFNLLELRWLLKRELDLNKEITFYIERLKVKLSKVIGVDAVKDVDLFKPMLTEILKEKLVDPHRIKEIESNIDSTINELAEIYPVFTYELSGRYKIKERLESAENYFEEMSVLLENVPKELTDWVQPKLTYELLNELDDYILGIAKKLGRKTKNQVSKKLSFSVENKSEEMDNFIDEYIERIKTMANNGEQA